jgi:hypothetical protein
LSATLNDISFFMKKFTIQKILMKIITRLTCLMFAIILCPLLKAQVNDSVIIAQIISTAKMHGEAMSTLKILTDSIGARVTGSEQSKKTSAYLFKKLKELGYDNARIENYVLQTRWTRKSATGRIVSPSKQPIHVGSYGWVPGTNGEIVTKIVDLGILNTHVFPERFEGVKGAAVIVEPMDSSGHPSLLARFSISKALAKSGATAMIIPSNKPDRMLYTSGFGNFPIGFLPMLSVAHEDILLIRRLLEHSPVTLALNIKNIIDKTPANEFNVLGEIPGTDSKDIILIGAHFDSWDLGEGAQDNGSGVAAVMEVARIFKTLGIKPKRTIRFAFFSGEEEALLGSRAYVIRHIKELDQHKSVLIMDDGAQVPKGFVIHGRTDIESKIQKELTTLAPLGATGISIDASFDTDHAPFLAAGIPSFTLWVNEGNYDNYHHTIIDTYDKVNPEMLASDAAVLAVALYTLSNSANDLGSRLSQNETEKFMKSTGLESVRKIVCRDELIRPK